MPEWVINDTHPSYRYSASACVTLTGNTDTSKRIALSKAKAEIALQINSKVTATRKLHKTTSESRYANSANEEITETIKITGSHMLTDTYIIAQGVYPMDNAQHYCLWLGSKKQ